MALALLLVMVSSVLGVWSCLINMQMLDRLNERLPVERRFAQLWWGPLKRIRFMNEYDREFPNDPMKKRVRLLATVMFACLGASALDLLLLR